MKKIVCLLLVLVLVMGLAACGGSEPAATENANTATEATTKGEDTATEPTGGDQTDYSGLQVGFGRESIVPTPPVLRSQAAMLPPVCPPATVMRFPLPVSPSGKAIRPFCCTPSTLSLLTSMFMPHRKTLPLPPVSPWKTSS